MCVIVRPCATARPCMQHIYALNNSIARTHTYTNAQYTEIWLLWAIRRGYTWMYLEQQHPYALWPRWVTFSSFAYFFLSISRCLDFVRSLRLRYYGVSLTLLFLFHSEQIQWHFFLATLTKVIRLDYLSWNNLNYVWESGDHKNSPLSLNRPFGSP